MREMMGAGSGNTKHCYLCDRPIYRRWMCRGHYEKWYRYGDPRFVTKGALRHGPLCVICGEPRKYKGNWGMCNAHASRYKRYGRVTNLWGEVEIHVP